MTLEAVVERFAARRSGSGWAAKCPAHEDARASLSIGAGDAGRVLLKCHAGCATTAILSAANLDARDLFPDTSPTSQPQIVATYPYTDETGALLYEVVRFSPKTFRQRRPDGRCGWIWKLGDVRRVPYRLPALHGQVTAYIVEGESDVEVLVGLGLPATTNAGGASKNPDKPKWRPEYTEQLQHAGVRHVVILPDNDVPGRAHGEAVARSCYAAGLAVKIVVLPNLPDKGDVSDWLEAGHTKADLVALVKGTAIYAPSAVPDVTAPNCGLTLTGLADLLAEPDETVDYLVADRLPCGSVAILAGKPKAGKSTAARALAFEVARAGSWLGFACLPRPVWYLALEDKRSEVRRHFRLMGADGSEPVRFLFAQPVGDLVGQLHVLATREHPGLIIVDTLQRLIRAADLNDYSETTSKLTPILTLARETGAAVLLVHHAGKSERAGIDAVLGSTALTGSVDNVFILSRTDKYRILSSIQRIGPDLPETVVSLDPKTGCLTRGATRLDADRANVETAILAALAKAEAPITEAVLEAAVEARTRLKHAALRVLVQAGRVRRDGKGGKGDPFTYRMSVPEAGTTNPAASIEAPDVGSCSLVPSLRWEQQNKNPIVSESLNTHGPDSCSLVPGVRENVGTVPEQASEVPAEAPDDHPDYLWRDPEELLLDSGDDGPTEPQPVAGDDWGFTHD